MSYKQINKTKWEQRFYYHDPETNKRREKKITAESKKETNRLKDEFLKQLEADKLHLEEKAKAKEDNKNNITFNEMFVPYFRFKRQTYKGSTAVTNERRIKNEILPFFGQKRIYDITTHDIVEWKEWIDKKEFSLEYSRSIYNLLSNMFKYAMANYGLLRNTAALVGTFVRPDEIQSNETIHFWTYEQFKAFIANVDELLWKTYFSTLYLTGMRKGESQALNWKDIDLINKRISISKSLTTKTSKEERERGVIYKVTPPKTKTSIRNIMIPDILVELLQKLYNRESQIDGFTDDCYVFGTVRFIPDTSIHRYLIKYTKIASLPKIKVHDFRHSHASYLINKNANIMIVAKHLGHKDVKETLNTYSHLMPDFEQSIIDIMNDEICL
ncbi:tyrosine-type recombinase/integrase [Candidatus Stoquefichus sp. SB1]|uniref:tyrosine-type recombinase/integrase n=1 Tax=Candidatus Stoquefichus sp. SB1 TaxID=1658109 RepID=UPI00067F0152|nr:site-specific integrase [Candidatus Stoquefichus sp. SB1]